jgi:hypothetical protein
MMSGSPSQMMIAAARVEGEVKDTRGRVIKYRRLNALDRAKLFKAIGPDHSTTAPYVGMAMMAASATEIDGVPIPFPFNESQIDAAIARLDDEGMEAVTIAIAVSRMPKSEEGNESGGDTSQ